jgi:hypothetical protein
MRTLTQPILLVASAMLLARAAAAQVPPVGGEPGSSHPTMKAAGMPLRDGALAPGMLTVRIVRGSFDNNAASQTVKVEVAGGKVETAVTGPDGRAQFVHLPIGGTVRASATVDGEALTSDAFEMAAESGIRVLLIAGDGAAVASGAAPDGPSTAASAPSRLAGLPSPSAISTTEGGAIAPAPMAGNGTDGSDSGVFVLRAVLVTATLLAFALLFSKQRPRRVGHGLADRSDDD